MTVAVVADSAVQQQQQQQQLLHSNSRYSWYYNLLASVAAAFQPSLLFNIWTCIGYSSYSNMACIMLGCMASVGCFFIIFFRVTHEDSEKVLYMRSRAQYNLSLATVADLAVQQQ